MGNTTEYYNKHLYGIHKIETIIEIRSNVFFLSLVCTWIDGNIKCIAFKS